MVLVVNIMQHGGTPFPYSNNHSFGYQIVAFYFRLTASVMSTITSVVSVIVMVETRTDSMHSRLE